MVAHIASRGNWSSPHEDLSPFLMPHAGTTTELMSCSREAGETIEAAWQGVYCRIYAAISDHDQAQELTQEVFCRVLSRLLCGQTESLKRAYLLQVAENLLRDTWRRQERRRTEVESHDRSSGMSTPEDLALRDEERVQLQDAIRELTQSQREVLYLRISQGLSVEETAKITRKSSASVRQTQSRALTALRRLMEEHNSRNVVASEA